MHTVSLGHWLAILMVRVRAGAEVGSFPLACFHVPMVYGKDNRGNKEKSRPCTDRTRPSDWRPLAPARNRRYRRLDQGPRLNGKSWPSR
jgi:hypothetical protein